LQLRIFDSLTPKSTARRHHDQPQVISLAGLLSGVLDLTATSTLFKSQGIAIERLLQTIASGALGPSAFRGGKKTATAGLLFHLLIAFVAASVFYAASHRMASLLNHPVPSGLFYGAAVHSVISRVVVPLSAAPKREFSVKGFFLQLVIHMFLVGLPIALIISHLAR
jgi:Na+-driven multidrug efflux pump